MQKLLMWSGIFVWFTGVIFAGAAVWPKVMEVCKINDRSLKNSDRLTSVEAKVDYLVEGMHTLLGRK